MKKHILFFSIILPSVLSISSCTEVVDINLNKAAPKLIIEGSVSDQPSDCYVKLSKTVNFDEPNNFPKVTGALVKISDNFGNTDLFTEKSAGFYTSLSFQGFAGREYTLSITAEGKTYTSTSVMPDPVKIDSIWQDKYVMGNFGGGGTIKYVKIQFKDPEGKNNYYRFVQTINGTEYNDIIIDNDQLRDGNNITQEIVRIDPRLKTGDNITMELQTIDKNVFSYFAQLNQISGHGFGGQSASPANPISNFNNGALGYFSAYSVRSKRIVIY
jgi:hypothetical protein